MKSDQPPDRLFASSDDDALRALLDAGRRERPTDAQLSAMAARLGPGGGGPGGGSGPAFAAKSTLGVAVKVIAAVVALGSIGAGIAFLRTPPKSVPIAPPVHVTEAPAAASAPPSAAEPTPPATPAHTPATTMRPSRPTPVVRDGGNDLGNEVDLVKQALEALPTEPAHALSSADEAEVRYPDGLLHQEAEVIAIEALVRLGRRGEAEARGRAFRAAYPGSPHVRRIELILSSP
jgi:hypothetical protein